MKKKNKHKFILQKYQKSNTVKEYSMSNYNILEKEIIKNIQYSG